ncbi:MAG TPA: PepSY-associated TM helix domain-containing protein [Nitrospira sp.]|nr:PepSY-associated TM helix domain-containing protein [Nitrospira sp.]
MKEIHSWSGLFVGWLLFAVSLTGALTVFDNEITYWMQPGLLEVSTGARELDKTVPRVTESLMQVAHWNIAIPTERSPALFVKLQEKQTFSGQTINPATGEMNSFRDTQGGDFFYHFHDGLLSGWHGAWLVGIAAIVMLVTLVNGLTTKSHLLTSVPMGQWAMAGVDLTGVTAGMLLGWAARRVARAAGEIPRNHTASGIVSDQRPAQM